jgi:hypothetical protein
MSYRVSLLTLTLGVCVALSLPLWSQYRSGGDGFGNMQPAIPAGPGMSMGNPDLDTMQYGSIAGTVSTADHHPAANAHVEVHDISTGAMIGSVYTDPSGRFRLGGVPRGSYEVVATMNIFEARERVDVDGSGIQYSVDLTLPHTESAASGGGDTVSVARLLVPEKAKRELQIAREAIGKGNSGEALKRIDKALKIDPQYADAFVLRGVVAIQLSNLNAALDDFQQALRCDPSASMAYVGTGAIFNMEGHFDEALRELDRGVALQPNSWQAQVEIAKANLGKGDFKAALAHANRAQELSAGQFYPIHLIKGHAFLGLKDYASAIPELRAFLTKNRNDQDAAAVRQEIAEAQTLVTTASASK